MGKYVVREVTNDAFNETRMEKEGDKMRNVDIRPLEPDSFSHCHLDADLGESHKI